METLISRQEICLQMLGFTCKSYYISFYTVVLVSTVHAVQTNIEHQQHLQVKVGEHIWH